MGSNGWESFTVRLPVKLARDFAAMAEKDGRSKNGMANVVIRAAVDADKQRRAAK